MKAFLLALFLALLTASSAPAVCTGPQWTITRTAPLVQYQTFFSAALGGNISYGVYVPAEYALNPTKNYPVLYWLHGGVGNATSGEGFVSKANAAMNSGALTPFIIVLPNGPQTLWTDRHPALTTYKAPIETIIIDELIPLIDSTYRTIANRDGRGVEGFSMGGRGAARLGLKFPDVFGLMSELAGALGPLEFWKRTEANSWECVFGMDASYFDATSPQTHAAVSAPLITDGRPYFYRVVVGTLDGRQNYNFNVGFSGLLTSLGIANDLITVPGVKHSYELLYDVGGAQMWDIFNEAWNATAYDQ